MPIYEYECPKCGHETEALKKFSDPHLVECDMCGAKMKKLISHSSFHLKGSGWYVTDYASKSGGNSGHHETSSKTATDEKPKESAESSKKVDTPTDKTGQKSSKESS